MIRTVALTFSKIGRGLRVRS